MNKRLSFVILITLLHFLFTLSVTCSHFAGHNITSGLLSPMARLLLSPVYYPLRGVLPLVLTAPALTANSLLWGVMAERLVFGRKTVWRRKQAVSR